jgi:hypothetical protein
MSSFYFQICYIFDKAVFFLRENGNVPAGGVNTLAFFG